MRLRMAFDEVRLYLQDGRDGLMEDPMHRIAALVMAALLPVAALAAEPGQQTPQKEATGKEATARAESWLALVDAGNYGKSWDEASSLFKLRVSAHDWAKAVQAARGPLGALQSRKATDTKFAHALPGAPDGDYVVITFHSAFAHKAEAVETVTMMQDAGSWRSAGYFIK